MADDTAFRSLPLGVEVLDQLLKVFDGLLCLVNLVLGFLLGPFSIPTLLSYQSDQFPLVLVDNELLILSSLHGLSPHDFQISVSRKKYGTTRLARIVVMIDLVIRLDKREKDVSTGYGKHLVAVLGEFDVKAESAFAEEICLRNACSDDGGEVDLHINDWGRVPGWSDQCGACASVGFGQFELATDVMDLVLPQ